MSVDSCILSLHHRIQRLSFAPYLGVDPADGAAASSAAGSVVVRADINEMFATEEISQPYHSKDQIWICIEVHHTILKDGTEQPAMIARKLREETPEQFESWRSLFEEIYATITSTWLDSFKGNILPGKITVGSTQWEANYCGLFYLLKTKNYPSYISFGGGKYRVNIDMEIKVDIEKKAIDYVKVFTPIYKVSRMVYQYKVSYHGTNIDPLKTCINVFLSDSTASAHYSNQLSERNVLPRDSGSSDVGSARQSAVAVAQDSNGAGVGDQSFAINRVQSISQQQQKETLMKAVKEVNRSPNIRPLVALLSQIFHMNVHTPREGPPQATLPIINLGTYADQYPEFKACKFFNSFSTIESLHEVKNVLCQHDTLFSNSCFRCISPPIFSQITDPIKTRFLLFLYALRRLEGITIVEQSKNLTRDNYLELKGILQMGEATQKDPDVTLMIDAKKILKRAFFVIRNPFPDNQTFRNTFEPELRKLTNQTDTSQPLCLSLVFKVVFEPPDSSGSLQYHIEDGKQKILLCGDIWGLTQWK